MCVIMLVCMRVVMRMRHVLFLLIFGYDFSMNPMESCF